MTQPMTIVPLDPAKYPPTMRVAEVMCRLRKQGYILQITRHGVGAVRVH